MQMRRPKDVWDSDDSRAHGARAPVQSPDLSLQTWPHREQLQVRPCADARTGSKARKRDRSPLAAQGDPILLQRPHTHGVRLDKLTSSTSASITEQAFILKMCAG